MLFVVGEGKFGLVTDCMGADFLFWLPVSAFGVVTAYPVDVSPAYLTTSVKIGVAGVNGGNPTAGTSVMDSSYINVSIFR